jgi:hypothetical protein
MMRTQVLKLSLLAGLLLLAVSRPAAATPFQISVDLGPLAGSDPLFLAFGFTDGNPATNAVTVSNFNFGGGSPVAGTADCTMQGSLSGIGCSGDLATGVTLTDATFDPGVDLLAFFAQQFTPGPGGSLSFVLEATHAAGPAGSFPDNFSMYLCAADFSTCYSDDNDLTTGSNALLRLDISGGPTSPFQFTTFAATDQRVAAPTVTAIDQTAVPEPATLLLVGGGLVSAAVRRKRRPQ